MSLCTEKRVIDAAKDSLYRQAGYKGTFLHDVYMLDGRDDACVVTLETQAGLVSMGVLRHADDSLTCGII